MGGQDGPLHSFFYLKLRRGKKIEIIERYRFSALNLSCKCNICPERLSGKLKNFSKKYLIVLHFYENHIKFSLFF